MLLKQKFPTIFLTLVLLLSPLTFVKPALAATVTIPAGGDIQAAVNANPNGTVFMLSAGTYRMQSISPKTGNVFDGSQGAVLNGSRLLTSFTQSGSVWYAAGQTQQGTRGTNECQAGFPRCHYPEDLFINDAPQLHVSSQAQVASGKWFFDYTADRIYIGENPSGKTVETSVTPQAFGGTASDVTIKNITIEKYASPLQLGAVNSEFGNAWIVQDSILRLNHGYGINFGSNSKVLRNKIIKNGMAGYGGGGTNFLVDSNEISNNNYAKVNYYWEGGGGKVTETASGGIIRNNCVANNDGPGIWQDIDANGTIIENNVVFGNTDNGIMYEISYDGIIRNNIVGNNGHNSPPGTWLAHPQIFVSSSSGVQVYGNTTDSPAAYGNGITVVSQDRKPWTPAINNKVYNNMVTLRSNEAATGSTSDHDADNAVVAAQNSFYNNTYHVLNFANDYWAWNDNYWTWTGIQGQGQEVGSTADTVLPPAPEYNCNFLGTTQPLNQTPIGSFDEIRLSDGVVRGWTIDPDQKNVSNQVHIYLDGPVGTGTLLSGYATNILRSDINSAQGATGNHGFEYAIPAQYKNGANHTIYIYGVDTSSTSVTTLLTGSPRSFNISSTGLVGDINQDCIVNTIDFSNLKSNWQTNDPAADLNHDGIVNTIDFSLMNSNWFKSC